MKRARVACVYIVSAAIAAPAAADVTFKRKNEGKLVTGLMSGNSVQFLKGSKMRDDQTIGGMQTSTIIDVASQKTISLNHQKREAEVYDMAKIGAEIEKQLPVSDIQARVSPTGQTRQVAGIKCTVHDMEVAVPMEMGGEKITFVMFGPVCLARDAPGQADMAAFYKAAADKGMFFGDPRAARAQPGQLKGMTAMYQKMAALGVPLAQEMNIKFEGSGPMAGMMSKMGGTTMTTEVVSISSEAIPDSTFEVPADYKVTKR